MNEQVEDGGDAEEGTAQGCVAGREAQRGTGLEQALCRVHGMARRAWVHSELHTEPDLNWALYCPLPGPHKLIRAVDAELELTSQGREHCGGGHAAPWLVEVRPEM